MLFLSAAQVGGALVKIFVIDNYAMFRYGLISMLKEHQEFQMIGDAASVPEAIAKLGELQPDIIIMDVFMPDGEGVAAITQVREKFPDVKIVIITLSDKEEDFLGAIRAGARAYLLKSTQGTELIESIRLVATGHAIVSPLIAFKLPDELMDMNKLNKEGLNSLSPREKEILRLVAQGASNKEIALQCYVSETTAKAHLRRILEKLSVRNRAQAAALAITKGLLNQV
jgi:DNA-binding NarL/FixJ family response regulator